MSSFVNNPMAASCPTTVVDPWVALFESDLPSTLKQGFMAQGILNLDGPGERATVLLAALVRSWRNRRQPVKVGRSPAEATEMPARLTDVWPDATGLSREELEVGGCPPDALLAGRLVAAGGSPFAHPAAGMDGADLLDVALNMNWSGLVIRLLQRHDVPMGTVLQSRASDQKLERRPLSWTHALAFANRTAELAAWLAVPGVDPNLLDEQGRTPLFYARSPEGAALLLHAGAHPNHRARNGRSVLLEWERPTLGGSWGTSPGNQAAMRAVLDDLPTDQPVMEVVHGWTSGAFQPWSALPKNLQDAMAAQRINVSPQAAAQTDGSPVPRPWGVVGYMGLEGVPFLATHLEQWTKWSSQVPQSMLDHESAPGIPDGMVLLTWMYAELHVQTLGILGEYPSVAVRLFNTLANRVLPEGSDRRNDWRLGMLRAMGLLLEHTPAVRQKDVRTTLGGVLRDELAFQEGADFANLDLIVARSKGFGRSTGARPEQIAALVEYGLATFSLRPLILQNASTLFPLMEDVPFSAAASVDDVWKGLLALHQVERTKATAAKYGIGTGSRAAMGPIEDLMERWIRNGAVPTQPRLLQTLGERVQKIAGQRPALASFVAGLRLNKAFPAAPLPSARPRM